MKIIFFGTNEFAAQILETLRENFDVVAVVTQPDKPVGRKQEMQPSPVSAAAEKSGIKTFKPATLKDSVIQNSLQELNPDIFVVAAYGKIIPQNILDIPKLGPLNVHGSLLPKYRGASPIHAALLNGDSQTGITIMLMDAQMDHGPILLKESLAIKPEDTFPLLEQKLCNLAQILLLKAIKGFVSGDLKPEPQDHESATFTKILGKQDGKIDWSKPAAEIYNQYRALITWPEIFTSYEGSSLKIKKCAVNDAQSEPGKVFEQDGKILVGTAEGSIELIEVQPEGKKNMAIKDFINGHKNFVGQNLI